MVYLGKNAKSALPSVFEVVCGGVVVSALNVRSEGRSFEASPLLSRCFLGEETLLPTVSLHPGV